MPKYLIHAAATIRDFPGQCVWNRIKELPCLTEESLKTIQTMAEAEIDDLIGQHGLRLSAALITGIFKLDEPNEAEAYTAAMHKVLASFPGELARPKLKELPGQKWATAVWGKRDLADVYEDGIRLAVHDSELEAWVDLAEFHEIEHEGRTLAEIQAAVNPAMQEEGLLFSVQTGLG